MIEINYCCKLPFNWAYLWKAVKNVPLLPTPPLQCTINLGDFSASLSSQPLTKRGYDLLAHVMVMLSAHPKIYGKFEGNQSLVPYTDKD